MATQVPQNFGPPRLRPDQVHLLVVQNCPALLDIAVHPLEPTPLLNRTLDLVMIITIAFYPEAKAWLVLQNYLLGSLWELVYYVV